MITKERGKKSDSSDGMDGIQKERLGMRSKKATVSMKVLQSSWEEKMEGEESKQRSEAGE